MTDYEKISADEVESLNELAKLDGAAMPALASEEYLKKIQNFEDFGEDAVSNDLPKDKDTDTIETDLAEDSQKLESKAEENKAVEDMVENKKVEEKPQDVALNKTKEESIVATKVEEAKQQPQGLGKTAEVFGVSQASLEDEFKRYKADRLFAKVILDLTNVDLTYKEALRRLGDAAAYNIYAATVLPNFVTSALKSNANIMLNIAVGYPYGVETFAAKKYMVKRAARRNVAGIVLYVDTNAYKDMKKRALAKELKALKKAARKKNFAIAIEISKLTTEELQVLANAVFQADIAQVVALPNSKTGLVDEYSLIRLCGMGKDKFDVVASAPMGEAEKAINFYEAGIAKFACENAVELAKSFKHKLGV